MTPIPARLMRGQAEACPTRPKPTERDRNRRAYILDAATRIFIQHGRFRVTLREFAVATGLTQIAIRNQICDMDHLFGLVLAQHLTKILTAVGTIHGQGPDVFVRRRAEYLRVTRGFCNVPTPLHFLWLRERFSLPEDELEPLENTARLIGSFLTEGDWQTALTLLDSAQLDQPQIETMLRAQAQPRDSEPAAQPAPRTAEPPAKIPQDQETPRSIPAPGRVFPFPARAEMAEPHARTPPPPQRPPCITPKPPPLPEAASARKSVATA